MQTKLPWDIPRTAFHLAYLVDWIQSNSSEESKAIKLQVLSQSFSQRITEKTCASWKKWWERWLGDLSPCFLPPCSAPEWCISQDIFHTSRLQIHLKTLLDSENCGFQSTSLFWISGYLPEESAFPGAASGSQLCQAALSTEMLLDAQQGTALISAVHNPAQSSWHTSFLMFWRLYHVQM